MDILTATPVEIDTVLAHIWSRYYAAYDKLDNARARLAGYRRQARHGSTFAADRINDAEMAVSRAQIAADAILVETEPYEAEWRRRGRWTRAYLVDNADGHLHRMRECSTCNKGRTLTRFYWVTELSGASQDEIVREAGETACTTCYPSAPVEVLSQPSKIKSPNRAERERARHG